MIECDLVNHSFVSQKGPYWLKAGPAAGQKFRATFTRSDGTERLVIYTEREDGTWQFLVELISTEGEVEANIPWPGGKPLYEFQQCVQGGWGAFNQVSYSGGSVAEPDDGLQPIPTGDGSVVISLEAQWANTVPRAKATLSWGPQVDAWLASPAAQCVTIDSSPDDNGALAQARQRLNPHGDNSTTAQAVDNLLRLRQTARASGMIFGHGNETFITTGAGRHAGARSDNWISLFTMGDWQTQMLRLGGHFQPLILWGCYTGAEQAGADLLFEIAKLANCSVSAPCGLAYSDGTCEGNLIQTATPIYPPTPLKAPSVPPIIPIDMVIRFASVTPGSYETHHPSTVVAAELSNERAATRGEIKLNRFDVQKLLVTIDFGNPFVPHMEPIIGGPYRTPASNIATRYWRNKGCRASSTFTRIGFFMTFQCRTTITRPHRRSNRSSELILATSEVLGLASNLRSGGGPGSFLSAPITASFPHGRHRQ